MLFFEYILIDSIVYNVCSNLYSGLNRLLCEKYDQLTLPVFITLVIIKISFSIEHIYIINYVSYL